MHPPEQAGNEPRYHHGNLREALVQAALALLSAQGSSAFSLSELARGLRVTPAAAYKHFADKQMLLRELAVRGFAALHQSFETAAPEQERPTTAEQAIHRFERIGSAYVAFGLREPALFQLIFGPQGRSFRQPTTANHSPSPTFAYLTRALHDLHANGVIAQPPTAADLWFSWSAIHGATELTIAGVETLVAADASGTVVAQQVIRALR